MSNKGHTAPLTASVRHARQRRKSFARLTDLLVCLEFYYDKKADFTNSELSLVEDAVNKLRNQLVSVA